MLVSKTVKRMEDVVVFVKSLTPGITRVGRDVRERAEELTSQVHRDLLLGSLERATNATPQLVSALKLYVNCPEGEKAQAADQRLLSQERGFFRQTCRTEIYLSLF